MRRRLGVMTALWAVLLLVAGCADFSDQDREREAGAFSSVDTEVQVSRPQPPPPSSDTVAPPPPGPCNDPDPLVITTCLASTGGVRAGDPQGEVTIVAERTTGRVLTAKRFGEQRELARFPVDGSGDGGLIDFAFSPTYDEDQLIYGLITTGSDNRVVRIAPGDSPKPILTGIPKGSTGNMGSMYFRTPTELVVATGNAGDPGLAGNRGSLAGKILLITQLRSGSNARPEILASGLGSNVALCPSTGPDGRLFFTDQGPTADRLQILDTGGPRELWSWSDRPGLSGCAAVGGSVFVSSIRTQQIAAVNAPTPEEPTVTEPVVVLEDTYGALGRMTGLPNGIVQFTTVNRAYGDPVSFDDRVVRFMPPAGAAEDRT